MNAIEVGKKVRELREQAGITQNALATRAGIAPSYIPAIEQGKKCPTVQTLSYICDALNISLSEFFNDATEQKEIEKIISSLSAKQKNSLLEFLKTI